MRTIRFPDGAEVSALGQGTWRMGETAALRQTEIAALRRGIDLGMSLIDTAEMYGSGRTEELVGEALEGLRDRVFLVSKAYPQNAGRQRLLSACENSLRRLGTDRLDLYLLHWRGVVPLAETVEAMELLVRQGKILRWGVSNFDVADMHDLFAAGGDGCATNQILYNLTRRGPERVLLPLLEKHGIPVMAYSPVEQGGLVADKALSRLAAQSGHTAAQLALAWVLQHPGVVAIPKAGSLTHLEENATAATLEIDASLRSELDSLFPPSSRDVPLEML